MTAKERNEKWVEAFRAELRANKNKAETLGRWRACALLSVLLANAAGQKLSDALDDTIVDLGEALWSEAERRERVAQRAATEQVVAHDEGVMETQPGPATLRPSTLTSNDEDDV